MVPAGLSFYAEVKRLLGELDEAVELARATEQGRDGVLRIGSVESATIQLLPPALAVFSARNARVRVHLRSCSSRESLMALREGRLDLAVLVPATAAMEGLNGRVVRRERFCLALPQDHPFADRTELRLSQLQGSPLVALFPYEISPGYASALQEALQKDGVHPTIYHADTTIFTKLSLVSARLGMALLPAPMKCLMVPGVRFVDLAPEGAGAITYDIAVALRSDSPASAEEFAALLPSPI